MTTPIRKVCRGLAALPPLPAVWALATDDHHLVLPIEPSPAEPGFDVRSIIDHFAPLLPDFTVVDSGGAVTIKKVIAEEDVLAQADAIMAAALEFRRTAADLMGRMSRKLGIALAAFYGLEYRPSLGRGWFRDRWSGRLDAHWK
jgi:hypothetical protein